MDINNKSSDGHTERVRPSLSIPLSFINETHTDSEKLLLKEWENIWGKFGLDYVNVVKYPDAYVKGIKKEYDELGEEFDVVCQNLFKEFEEEVTRDFLTSEQRNAVEKNDTAIKNYKKKAISLLQSVQLQFRVQEIEAKHEETMKKYTERIIENGHFP